MTIGDDHLPNYPVTEMVIDTIADWVRKYRNAVGIHNELTHCDAQEVKAIAKDLGLTTADLRKIASKGSDSADLLKRMLGALGVDKSEEHTSELQSH